LPGTGVEVLVPDFLGREPDIATVLASGPTVFGHNLETCERLTPMIRSGADYRRSLQVLAAADRLARGKVRIKSGFMLGLGEDHAEVRQLLRDLRRHAVTSLTIGQYLPPSRQHWPVARYVTPAEFAEWGRVARQEFGFTRVASAPLVRSSYMAEADSPPVPGKAGTGRLSEHVSASPASP
jgi:lipoic acid synthetase